MPKTNRVVTVTVSVRDSTSSYDSEQRGTAERKFPAETPPAEIGQWAARAAFGQVRDAQASYPLVPAVVEAERPDPAQVLARPATLATDVEADAVLVGDDLENLPF